MIEQMTPLHVLAKAHQCSTETIEHRCHAAGIVVKDIAKGSRRRALAIRTCDIDRLSVAVQPRSTPAIPSAPTPLSTAQHLTRLHELTR